MMATRPPRSLVHFDLGGALKRASPGTGEPGFSEGVFGPFYFKSSNVVSALYDPATSALEVSFNSGAVYRYANVPENLWHSLLNADSKGRFLSQQIKGRHRATRVT